MYYLNWGIIILIVSLLLFSPIINISKEDKNSPFYGIGNLFEYYQESYTLHGVTDIFADKFMGAEEWVETKDLIGGEKCMMQFTTRDVVITVVLFFVISYIVIYAIILFEYICSLFDIYKKKRRKIIYGKGFCVATLILCIMCIIMLSIVNGYFNNHIIDYTVSPFLIMIMLAALINWIVIIPEYNKV